MNKYKIEFKQTELYIVDVEANNQTEAEEKATEEWNKGNYQKTGDTEISINTVYDVTNTDDPFNP